MTNKLFYGDNPEVLRTFPVACVDLDPPFNSNASYNVRSGRRAAPARMRASRRSADRP